MTGRHCPAGAAKDADKSITCFDSTHGWTGLVCLASAVDFSGSNAGKSYPRTLGAPDRAIPVPDGDWRALKRGTGGNYRCCDGPNHGSTLCKAMLRLVIPIPQSSEQGKESRRKIRCQSVQCIDRMIRSLFFGHSSRVRNCKDHCQIVWKPAGFLLSIETASQGGRMNATDEQQAAMAAFQTGGDLKINAFAGTGKTTTLELLSKKTSRHGIYLAFNKSIASEAQERFASSVACSTVHSLAYRATPSAFKHGNKMTGRFNANALAEEYKLEDLVVGDHCVTARSQAHLALITLKHFMQSDSEEVTTDHVPSLGRMKLMDVVLREELQEVTKRRAQKLWGFMRQASHHLPLGHDGYLKMWALDRPRLAADYIMLDEAQDTNSVVLGVLGNQATQTIYVGDKHQQIYAWRGAVNAMERIATPHVTHLTTSFRFGQEIASAATQVLWHLGEKLPLRGNPDKRSYLSVQNCRAILARTNANVIATVIQKMALGFSVYVMGGVGEIVRMLEAVSYLKQGRPSDLPEFFGFADWKEVIAFSQTDEGEELRTFVGLVEQHGEQQLIQALRATASSEEAADIVVSTAHKAKGREWDTVELLDDFLKSRGEDENGEPKPLDQEEARLFYVALTRARIGVQAPANVLAMFDVRPTQAMPGGGGVQPTGHVITRGPSHVRKTRAIASGTRRTSGNFTSGSRSVRPVEGSRGGFGLLWWIALIAVGFVVAKLF